MRSLWIVGFAVMVACGDPRDAELPPGGTALLEDSRFRKSLEALSQEEREKIAKFYIRSVMTGGVPPGTKIRDALTKQTEFEDAERQRQVDAAALAAKIEAERKALRAQFDGAVTVAITKKSFAKADWRRGEFQDRINVSFGFQNKTEKAIAGLKGVAV